MTPLVAVGALLATITALIGIVAALAILWSLACWLWTYVRSGMTTIGWTTMVITGALLSVGFGFLLIGLKEPTVGAWLVIVGLAQLALAVHRHHPEQTPITPTADCAHDVGRITVTHHDPFTDTTTNVAQICKRLDCLDTLWEHGGWLNCQVDTVWQDVATEKAEAPLRKRAELAALTTGKPGHVTRCTRCHHAAASWHGPAGPLCNGCLERMADA